MAVVSFFSALAILSSLFSMFFSDTRRVIVSAWIAGMSVGALFLAYGAEYLALLQWIVSTLIAVSFLIYSTMFGEYGPVDSRTTRQRVFDLIPSVLAGGAFFVMLALAALGGGAGKIQSAGSLIESGRALGERHMISLELLGLMLLAVLIGAGVLSQPERKVIK